MQLNGQMTVYIDFFLSGGFVGICVENGILSNYVTKSFSNPNNFIERVMLRQYLTIIG